MSHVPPGRGEVGETIANFPSYEAAQKAVSTLIAADIPARDIAIVGHGLRSVERVTGRLGYATAARSGAVNGVLLGLFFSALFVLGNDKAPVSAFVGVLFVGIALGMLFSIGAYAVVRRRRDFASVMQVMAERYEVTVLAGSIHRAREVLGPSTIVARPPRPTRDPGAEPPRYGERVPASGPAYGEMARQPPADEAGEAGHGDEAGPQQHDQDTPGEDTPGEDTPGEDTPGEDAAGQGASEAGPDEDDRPDDDARAPGDTAGGGSHRPRRRGE